MFDDAQKEELRQLINAQLENKLTKEQAARLREMAFQDDDACMFYIDYMALHGLLVLEHAETETANFLADILAEEANECECFNDNNSKKSQSPPLSFLGNLFQAGTDILSRSFVLTLLLSIGLPAIVLTLLLVDLAHQPVPTPPGEVARIMGMHQAVWGDADGDLATGVFLTSGRKVALEKGLAELEFLDGTRVILQGPATFQVGLTTNGFLNRGTLTATVPPAARGFTINTPMARIVDLGTEFGVSVLSDGTAETHVFKGQVEIETRHTTANASPSKMKLTKGQAAKISRPQAGQAPRILAMASASNRFVRRLPAPAPAKSGPKLCFAHRGNKDPVSEGWKVLYRGKNAKVEQDAPCLVPVKDGDTDAWMIDNRISHKKITYHSNRKSEKGGLTPEMYELGKAKGWSLRARLKAESAITQKSSTADTSAYFWFNDGEKIWAIFVQCLRDGTQYVRISNKKKNENDFREKMPNSHDRYIDYEIRYHPATKDAEVFIDGKLVIPHFVGSTNAGYQRTGERGVDFGLQTKEGKAKFALIEWKVLDETTDSEQKRGDGL